MQLSIQSCSIRGARGSEKREVEHFRCTPSSNITSVKSDVARSREVSTWLAACSSLPRRPTLQGSFSAVSRPNFASKYAFESSRRDLHNALLCTALQSQFFVKNLPNNLLNFAKLVKILKIFGNFGKILATF